mgnify:CR=1 FL=1
MSCKIKTVDLKMWFGSKPKRVRVEDKSGKILALKEINELRGIDLRVWGEYDDGGQDSLLMLSIDDDGKLVKGWRRGILG